MVVIEDDIASEFDSQPRFSTIKKNFGNKLSIYAVSRIIAEDLNYSLIVPDKALIGRNLTFSSKYVPMQYYQEFFPFKGFIGYNIDYPECFIDDNVLYNYGSVEELIKNCKGSKIISAGYYSKYEYLKPYKGRIKTFYKDIISDNKKEGIERPNRSSISFWLCYLKPIKTDREFIICFSFQKDFRGKIIIEPNRILVARNLYDTVEEMLTEEISKDEFYSSLNSIVRDINTFLP